MNIALKEYVRAERFEEQSPSFLCFSIENCTIVYRTHFHIWVFNFNFTHFEFNSRILQIGSKVNLMQFLLSHFNNIASRHQQEKSKKSNSISFYTNFLLLKFQKFLRNCQEVRSDVCQQRNKNDSSRQSKSFVFSFSIPMDGLFISFHSMSVLHYCQQVNAEFLDIFLHTTCYYD